MIRPEGKRIAAAGSLLVQTGECLLVAVDIVKGAVGATLTVYDGIDGTGEVKGVYDCTNVVPHAPLYRHRNGIYVTMAGGDADVLISYA